MKRNKLNSGITLIALIITIIVLLILAGVTISLVVGDNGILNQALNSADRTNENSARSELELAITAVVTEWNVVRHTEESVGTLTSYMTKARVASNMNTAEYTLSRFALNTNNGVTVEHKGTAYLFTVSITESGNSAEVTYEGKSDGTGGSGSGGTGETKVWSQVGTTVTDGENTYNIGDYVNYDEQDGAIDLTYSSETTASGYTSQQVFTLANYTYGWRIFGVEDGKLQLISEEIIGPSSGGYSSSSYGDRTYYYLNGRTGYQNALTELQNICNLYGQGEFADGVRSITVEDINKLTGYNPETANYESGQLHEYGNTIDYFWQGTNYPYYSSTRSGNDLTGNLRTNHNNSYGNSFWWFDENSNNWNSSAYQSGATTPTEPINDTSLEQDNYITTLESNYYRYTGSDYLTDTNSAIYKMLFCNLDETGGLAGTGNAGSTDGMWYWLASRCVRAEIDNPVFGVRYVDYGNVFGSRLARLEDIRTYDAGRSSSPSFSSV